MKKNTYWTHGKVEFVAPPLSLALQNITGCNFQKAVFDPKVGNEQYGPCHGKRRLKNEVR